MKMVNTRTKLDGKDKVSINHDTQNIRLLLLRTKGFVCGKSDFLIKISDFDFDLRCSFFSLVKFTKFHIE